MAKRLVEIIGTSGTSFEDATHNAYVEAKNINNVDGKIKWGWVIDQSFFCESDKIAKYQVTCKISYDTED